jgi:hypothetical protein
MLQLHLDVAYVLQLLHTYFSSVSGILTRVSDVCYKCFSCFGRMVQVFHLDVPKVDRDAPYICCNVPRLPQPPAAVAGASCMRVMSGGMERCSAASGEADGDGVGGAGGPRMCAGSRGAAQA